MEYPVAPSSTLGTRFWNLMGSSATTLNPNTTSSSVSASTARPSVSTTLMSSGSREPTDLAMDAQIRSLSALVREVRASKTLLVALKDLEVSPSLREYLVASSRTLRRVGSSEPAAITAALAWALYVYLQSENSFAHWIAAARAFSRPAESLTIPDRFRLKSQREPETLVDSRVLGTASTVRNWLQNS